MFSYGLMPLLIPLGVVAVVFNIKTGYKKSILIGFVFMSLALLVSITRRDIIGILIYFFLAILLYAFISSNLKIFFTKALKSFVVLVLIIICTFFVFPKVIEATRIGIVETINIVEHSKESNGSKDERLRLRPFIVSQFVNHPIMGTGFDNRWRTSEGDKLGFEASDYPFLAALAMFGIVGNVFFLPVYILLLLFLKNDLKFLRDNYNINYSLLYLLLVTFILYFIYDFLQYPNYFLPVSNAYQYTWYSSLAFYLAIRNRFYSGQNLKNIPQLKPN